MSSDRRQQGDYRALVRTAARDERTFLRLTLSGTWGEGAAPWVRISMRPVVVKGQRMIQFSYFTAGKDITKNFPRDEAAKPLDEALAMPFSRIHVQTTAGDIHVRITRKGKALVTKGRASSEQTEPRLAHDHVKQYPLPLDKPDPFLQAFGIMASQGKVRAAMQAKFRQINEFLRIIELTVLKNLPGQRPLHLADCGCGSAHLTFAAYHYLNHVRGVPTRLTGVDKNKELVEKCDELRDSLGWDGLEFHVSPIVEFEPTTPPDVVLSLHACDTATDEAIAQGIRWGSRVILAAPCCQHELHHQLASPLFQPLLRHGILRERLADLLTDTFRALALRVMGYRASVIEFISPEHTAKNLMIQAERGLKPGDAAVVEEYKALKSFWDITPAMERLLGQEFQRLLSN